MSGTGVEKLQTILMAQVSTIDQPDQISIDYTKRFELSLFRYKLWMDTSTSMHTCIFINNGQIVLKILCFKITLDTLSIWPFALPVGCSQESYHCIHSSTRRLFKNHQSRKSEGSRNREKVFVQRLSQLNCKMKKWHWSAFFDVANPKGNSSSKLLRIEDQDAWRTFRGPPCAVSRK